MGLTEIKEPLLTKAKEIILEKGDVAPIVFFVKEQRVVGMAPVQTELVPERIEERFKPRAAMYILGLRVRIIPTPEPWDSICYIATMWTVKTVPGEPPPKPPLAEHPMRVEVLTITFSRGKGDHEMEAIPFYRSPDGPVFQEPLEKVERVESRLLDAFWAGYQAELAD